MEEAAFYIQGNPADKDGALPSFVEFRHYIPTLEDRYRGYEYINGTQFELIHRPETVFPEGYEQGLIDNMNKALEEGAGDRIDAEVWDEFPHIEDELTRHQLRMMLDRLPQEVDTMNFQGKRAMPELHAFDILMWVGETHYETPREFIDEAFGLGFSKRIASPPECVWPGKTKVYFAHRKAIWDEVDKEWRAAVFGYAYLSHTIWTKPRTAKKVPEKVEDLERLGRVEVIELGDQEGSVDPNEAIEDFGQYPEGE
jgi:hypothetical protein